MLNRGFTNTMVGMPVPCDMKALLEAEFNKLKESGKYDNNDLVEEIEEELESTEESEKVSVLFDAIWPIETFEDSVIMDYDVADNIQVGKMFNGAEVVFFEALAGETYVRVFKMLYFDGKQLRVYTPFEGNAVNITTMTALGDENVANKARTMEIIDLIVDIYGKDMDKREMCEDPNVEKYIQYFVPGVTYDEFTPVELYEDAMMDEIDREVKRQYYKR